MGDEDMQSMRGGSPEPDLYSGRNRNFLRYLIVAVILVVLLRFLLYSMEVQRSSDTTPDPIPGGLTQEEIEELDE